MIFHDSDSKRCVATIFRLRHLHDDSWHSSPLSRRSPRSPSNRKPVAMCRLRITAAPNDELDPVPVAKLQQSYDNVTCHYLTCIMNQRKPFLPTTERDQLGAGYRKSSILPERLPCRARPAIAIFSRNQRRLHSAIGDVRERVAGSPSNILRRCQLLVDRPATSTRHPTDNLDTTTHTTGRMTTCYIRGWFDSLVCHHGPVQRATINPSNAPPTRRPSDHAYVGHGA